MVIVIFISAAMIQLVAGCACREQKKNGAGTCFSDPQDKKDCEFWDCVWDCSPTPAPTPAPSPTPAPDDGPDPTVPDPPDTAPGSTTTADLSALEPYSEECCKIAAQQAGLMLGGEGYKFADDHLTKGCYTFTSGTYKGYAYYGTGGTEAENKAALNQGYLIRVQGYDQCGEKGAANDAPGPPAPSPPPPAPAPLTAAATPVPEKLLTTDEQSGCNCCHSKASPSEGCWVEEKEKSDCLFWQRSRNNACAWRCVDETDFSCDSGILTCDGAEIDGSTLITTTSIVCGIMVFILGCCISFKKGTCTAWGEAWKAACKKVMKFAIALIKVVGGVVGLVFKYQAVLEIQEAHEGLVAVRTERNLGVFDNCCQRMTAAEANCGTAMILNMITIFISIFLFWWKAGGAYNPAKGCCAKVFMIIFKHSANILFCIFVSAGISATKSVSFDWGQGSCPKDGKMEQEMDEINQRFEGSMRSIVQSIIFELVMIEVMELFEGLKEKCKKTDKTDRVVPVES